jgi:outer membrane lipoprotein-sorting protein
MFRKNLQVFIALMGVSFQLFTSQVYAQTDKKALAVLDGMSDKIKSLKSFKAGFTYTPSGQSPLKGEATVKGTKFRLKIAGQEILNDGKLMATYIKETNEVNIQDYDPDEQGDFNPAKIYTIYKKGYKYSYLGESKVGAQAVETVELVPTGSGGQVSKLQIVVGKTDKNAKSWTVFQKNGQKTSYKVDSFQDNPNVNDTYFTFNARMFPGAEIVDLR